MSGVGSHSDDSSVEDSRLRSHMSFLHGFIACHPTRMQDAVSRDIVYRDEIAASASQEAMPSDPRVITTFSTSRRAYLVRLNGCDIISESQRALGKMIGASVSESRIALALCPNLPGVLRQIPFWEGVKEIPAGYAVKVVDGAVEMHPTWTVSPGNEFSIDEAASRLRESILDSVRHTVARHGRVSSDVSGGMDSTSLAYLLGQHIKFPVLYHAPTKDPQNVDTRYAHQAIEEIGGDSVELPSLTDTISAFSLNEGIGPQVSDDGPLLWGSSATHLRGLLEDASVRGVNAHLVGLGGDELFSVTPALVLLSRRSRSVRGLLLNRLWRTARMQKWNLTSTFRSGLSHESYAKELLWRVHSRKYRRPKPEESFRWAPGFSISSFASEWARQVVIESVESLISCGVEPYFTDKFRHQMAESVKFQGEVVRQMNYVFRDLKILIEAPFISDAVTSLVLGFDPKLWLEAPGSKPILAAAMRGVVPERVFSRPDKGEYSADLFADFIIHRESLRKLFKESYLADLGYINADLVVKAIDAPLLGTDHLFELEHLVSVERWVRSI